MPKKLSPGEASSADAALERVKQWQAKLASSSDLNPMTELMAEIRRQHRQLSSTPEPRAVTKTVALAMRILSQSFVSLCDKDGLDFEHADAHGRLTWTDASDAKAQVSRWLKQQWNAFVDLLHDELLLSDAPTVRLAALDVSMALQVSATEAMHRQASVSSSSGGHWSVTPFRGLVQTLLWRTVADDVVDAMAEGYLETYDDVRFMFCKEVSRLLRHVPDASVQNAHVRSRARLWMCRITAIPTKDSHLNHCLVPYLAAAKKPKSKAKKAKMSFTEDGASDEEADAAEPWFSDTDEEEDGTEKAPAPVPNLPKRKRKRHGGLLDSVYSLPAQRQAFAAAWLSLLLPHTHTDAAGKVVVHGGVLSLAETHDILVRLHTQILPHLPKPTMLHDFLVDCLDTKGVTALLALNGLFTLIVHHNLDYPAFYTRLYALLDASVMHTRYRSRFMRMLNVFLSSTHLPVAIVASFLKRLSRLSLRATPAALVEIVPFVWNLLKRHPSCMCMIHREWDGDHLALGPSGVQDGFQAHETDPLHTNALESSLWEIATFGAYRLSQSSQQGAVAEAAALSKGGDTHYQGSVTSFASILAEPFSQNKYELEDFLDSTYTTLFETETRKTLQRREKKNKAVVPPPVAPLDLTLSVPALLADKTGHIDQAIRRESRKRLRLYAFPSEAPPAGETPLEESRRKMPLDACARLWDLV